MVNISYLRVVKFKVNSSYQKSKVALCLVSSPGQQMEEEGPEQGSLQLCSLDLRGKKGGCREEGGDQVKEDTKPSSEPGTFETT